MTDQWLSVYFNRNKETNIYVRETYFVADTANNNKAISDVDDDQSYQAGLIEPNKRSDFWTQSAYHRVFGLFIRRRRVKKVDGSQHYIEFRLCAFNQLDTKFANDWHKYAIYWPVVNYPAFIPHMYFDDTGVQHRMDWADSQKFRFYQSITSLMITGLVRLGNANSPLTRKQKATQRKLMYGEDKLEVLEQQYFRYSARKQLGDHVFIQEGGLIISCYTYFYLNPTNNSGPRYVWKVDPISNLNAIYPTIRNEWYEKRPNTTNPVVQWRETNPITLTRQVFTMGLAYRRFGLNNGSIICLARDNQTGQLVKPYPNEWNVRYYQNGRLNGRSDHRLYTRKINELYNQSVAGVYDLTEILFNEIFDEYLSGTTGGQPIPNTRRFALYMCSGSKLIVMDSYQSDVEHDDHNRCLFEQGSVVIVEDILEMTVPYNPRGRGSSKNPRIPISWLDFCNKYIQDIKLKDKIRNYLNPVVFIGSHESDYNTSAWRLMIDKFGRVQSSTYNGSTQRYVNTYERRCYLIVPEGAYIMAVEDWQDGMEEIRVRHRYEQLHRSIVRHQTPDLIGYIGPTGYQLPIEEIWLQKIIFNTSGGQNQVERDIPIDIVGQTTEIREAYEELLGQQFNDNNRHLIRPKEFNFSRFVDVDPNQLARDSRVYSVPPPAYPPVKIIDKFGQQRLYYLPQKLSFDPLIGVAGGGRGAGRGVRRDADPGVNPDGAFKANLLTVFKKYVIDPVTYCTIPGNDTIKSTNTGKHYLRLSTGTDIFDEYEWECVDNPFVDKHRLLNCDDYRLAVDGHYYRKSQYNPNVIGKVRSYYYDFIAKETDQPFKANIQTNSGIFADKDNSFRMRDDQELADRFLKRPMLSKPY